MHDGPCAVTVVVYSMLLLYRSVHYYHHTLPISHFYYCTWVVNARQPYISGSVIVKTTTIMHYCTLLLLLYSCSIYTTAQLYISALAVAYTTVMHNHSYFYCSSTCVVSILHQNSSQVCRVVAQLEECIATRLRGGLQEVPPLWTYSRQGECLEWLRGGGGPCRPPPRLVATPL